MHAVVLCFPVQRQLHALETQAAALHRGPRFEIGALSVVLTWQPLGACLRR